MGMGSEGGAGASANTGEIAGLGPYAVGGGSTGGGGALAQLKTFMQDPKNVQLLGQLMQQGSRLRETANKLPPVAKQFFESAMAKGLTGQMGGGGAGAPTLGNMQPQSGPYMGDASAYNIDPTVARSVLSRMG